MESNKTTRTNIDYAICGDCGGFGYTTHIQGECCNNYLEGYVCCNIPNPIQVQEKCKCDNGLVRIF